MKSVMIEMTRIACQQIIRLLDNGFKAKCTSLDICDGLKCLPRETGSRSVRMPIFTDRITLKNDQEKQR